MKKFLFASALCLAALCARAQVVTAEVVGRVYEQVMSGTDGKFVYNVEQDAAGRVATAFVYERRGRRGRETLRPSCQYRYDYAADGLLLSRTAYRWHEGRWVCMGRLDYAARPGCYAVEYSRWNERRGRFDASCERMVYSLPDSVVGHVYCYRRPSGGQAFQLDWLVAVGDLPLAGDSLLSRRP